MKFHLLVNELHLYIALFLDHGDKIRYGSCCVKFSKELLLHHLRSLKVKAESIFFTQKRRKTFGEMVAVCVLNPERQLQVRVYGITVPPSFPFLRVHSLTIDFNVFQSLTNQIESIHHLVLHIDQAITGSDLIALEIYGIKSLVISNNMGIEVPFRVIPPPSLEFLELRGSYVSFTPALGNVFFSLLELVLMSVNNVTNVSMFVNIMKLSFIECDNIVDIRPLQNNRDITFELCNGILDYRNALTHSRRIVIISPNPKAIIDPNCFKEVQVLHLIETANKSSTTCPRTIRRLEITKTIPLSMHYNQLQELTVSDVSTLHSVKVFGCIPILTLTRLQNLQSLHGLGYDEDPLKRNLKNRKVSINMLENIHDFTPLNTVNTVFITLCNGLHDLGDVRNVQNLKINSNVNILLQSTFPIFCKKITLVGPIHEGIFPLLRNAKELDIQFASIWPHPADRTAEKGLQGLETLENLERVVISSAWKEQETKAWEMLKQDYFKFEYNAFSVIYVKRARL